MSTTTENETEFRCSCGRTFAHEISLKRHRWVTGHAEAEGAAAPAEAAPAAAAAVAAVAVAAEITPVATAPSSPAVDYSAEIAYNRAMEILMLKQQEQQEYERRLQMQAKMAVVGEFIDWVGEGVMNGANAARETAEQAAFVGRQAVALAVRLLVMLAVMGSLLLTGVGVGRVIARTADAAPAVVTADAAQPSFATVSSR